MKGPLREGFCWCPSSRACVFVCAMWSPNCPSQSMISWHLATWGQSLSWLFPDVTET
jgi:hypothetical protein